MRTKTITIDDFKKENKKRAFKEKVRNTAMDVSCWISNNKELVLILGPAVIGGLTTGIKVIGKHNNLRKEKDLKDLYCYDRSLGHYWRLKRELTNSEWVEIDKRKNSGERLADILDELKVLK